MPSLILNASRIVTEAGELCGSIRIENDRISEVSPLIHEGALDLGDVAIIPGLIDIHIHGREARDVMDADLESLEIISASLARFGVTGFLATTVTSAWDQIIAALRVVGQTDGDGLPGARMLGAYSEGCFFNGDFKGAHNADHFLEPTPGLINEMIEAAAGKLKVMALAPEINGAIEALELATRHGIRVMIGHSNATYDQTKAAMDAGGCGGVHVFNGMRGIHHRDPGCAGAVLLEPGLVEVIADGVHLHPAILDLITRLKDRQDIILISDCMCAGGLDDGTFRLGEMDVTVTNGIARVDNGSLAGSTLTLNLAIGQMMEGSGASLTDAVHMASLSPARFLGLDQEIGSLAAGKRADMAIVDSEMRVRSTLVGGRLVWLDPTWERAEGLAAACGACQVQ